MAQSPTTAREVRPTAGTGPLNRRLATLRARLPLPLRPWLPDIPPATPRNLWLLLALLVATQNIAVFHTSQSDKDAILAVLVWGGALICMEDQLEDLRPQPGWAGLLFGSVLLLFVLARSSVIVQGEGILYALVPLAGLALALLCRPWPQMGILRDSLICLLLLPLYRLVIVVLPEKGLSLLTAQFSGFFLSILGLEVLIDGRNLMLPGGSVQVGGPCNGMDIISQLTCISVIFLLAFPLRSWRARLFLLLISPVIGLISNALRIALLAVLNAMGPENGKMWFDFFHEDAGSLVFSGLAVALYGFLYLRILERELSPVVVSTSSKGEDP